MLERLRSAERLLDEIDVSALEGADLQAITGAMRRIEARCAAVVEHMPEVGQALQSGRVSGDGMGHLHVTADPERFAKLQTAIEHQTATIAAASENEGESVTIGPALQLDALVQLVGTVEGVAGRPSFTIVVDQATLTNGPHDRSVCETSSGISLPVPVVDRYLCDADVRRVVLDDAGLPLNVGRKYRTATPAQWAALEALYATCIWEHCDVPFTWCQAHHVQHWEHGGPTDLWNLAPLCGRHHHVVHDDGWRLILHPDRTLEIHRPRSHPPPTGQPPPPPSPDSLWATTRPNRILGYE